MEPYEIVRSCKEEEYWQTLSNEDRGLMKGSLGSARNRSASAASVSATGATPIRSPWRRGATRS